MLLQRILSALLLIPAFLLLVQFGSPFHFSLLVGVAILLGSWEFARLCPAGTDAWCTLLTVLGALAWQAALLAGAGQGALPLALAGLALARVLAAKGELRVGVVRAAWVVFGMAYVGGLMGTASLLRAAPDGQQWIYYLTFITWAGDSGAYFVGSRFGRRPLAPRVSPKKTWEGTLGGTAATVLVAIAGSGFLWPRLPWAVAAAVGILLAVAGLLGDLAESAIKRAAGVKDSGALIPGHGGVLDRLDSLMFAAPVLYGLVWVGWV